MRKKNSSATETEDETLVSGGDETSTIESTETSQDGSVATEHSNLVSRTVYKTVYAVTFGVVFSSLLVSRLIVPKDSMVAKALHDGTIAAQKAVEDKEQLIVEVAQETVDIMSGGEPTGVPL